MKITQLAVGPMGVNCYILASDEGNAAIVDPGYDHARILQTLQAQGLTAKMILLTHGHFDHIWAVADLLAQCKVSVSIHAGDFEMLQDNQKNLADQFGVYGFCPITSATMLQDGQTLSLDEVELKVLHTPGHSKGSVCFICEKTRQIFVGDTIFQGSVGRTDCYGGDYKTLMASVRKLAELEGEYTLYPGHGPSTTLQQERVTNPYLGSASYDDLF